jgi:hypothetical protein
MDFFFRNKRDGKKPTPDMDGNDYQTWDRARRLKSADDADHVLNRMKPKVPNNITRHRIWPKNEHSQPSKLEDERLPLFLNAPNIIVRNITNR